MGFTGLRIFGDGSLSADGLAAGDTAVGRFIKASDPFNVTGGNVAIFQSSHSFFCGCPFSL